MCLLFQYNAILCERCDQVTGYQHSDRVFCPGAKEISIYCPEDAYTTKYIFWNSERALFKANWRDCKDCNNKTINGRRPHHKSLKTKFKDTIETTAYATACSLPICERFNKWASRGLPENQHEETACSLPIRERFNRCASRGSSERQYGITTAQLNAKQNEDLLVAKAYCMVTLKELARDAADLDIPLNEVD